jgi:hypothetical protein
MMGNKTKEHKKPASLGSQIERVVIRFEKWLEYRAARRLYNRIWKANNIILKERHDPGVKEQNRRYWKNLEYCSDALERATAVIGKKIN